MPNDEPEQQKACVVCALRIPEAAKICTHCSSPQNRWIRRLGRVGVVGAAIAALIPLVDGAWSLREIARGQHRADVRVRAVVCKPEGIVVAVMNFGRGPAVVTNPVLRVDGPHLGDASKVGLQMDVDAKVVAPSEVQSLMLTGTLGSVSTDLPRTSSPDTCKYHATLTVEDVSTTIQKDAECHCPTG